MKGKKEKVILVFDEKDRRDFLTGFRKRKNARRKKAQEENKKKEEERKKQQREEKREALRKHVQEYENQLESNTEFKEDISKQPETITHDFGQHTVTVSTITEEDMGKGFLSCCYQTQNELEKQVIKTTSNSQKQPIQKDKLHRKRQFRKKAQKRKIQALGHNNKTKSKQKLKHKGKINK